MYHEAAKISGERFCVFYPFKNRFFLNPWVQLEFFRNCGSISKIVAPAFEMMMNSRVAWLKQIVISRWVIWREQCSDGHHSASNQGSRRNSSPFHCTSSHKLCHQLNWLQMLQNRQNMLSFSSPMHEICHITWPLFEIWKIQGWGWRDLQFIPSRLYFYWSPVAHY